MYLIKLHTKLLLAVSWSQCNTHW